MSGGDVAIISLPWVARGDIDELWLGIARGQVTCSARALWFWAVVAIEN